MKAFKKFLAILFVILLIGAVTSSITCTYYFHWNTKTLWWSLAISIFVLDIIFGLYIFYNKTRPDETKAFWLIVLVLLPVLGLCIFVLVGFSKRCDFTKSDNNHARLLSSIFNAKKSIKIYTDTFYPSLDTFNALNFVVYKNIKIDILLTTQKTKSKQEYLEYKLEQLLDKKIKLHFTNLCVSQSFIIIDDKEVITCPGNFNFKNIYSNNQLKVFEDTKLATEAWDHAFEKSSLYNYRNAKFSRAKKLRFAIINIFYSFL